MVKKSSSKFIPELHDIGKLVDSEVKEDFKKQIGSSWNGHTFIGFDFEKAGLEKPTSPSWWGQYHHYKHNRIGITEKDINNWNWDEDNKISNEDKYHLFLLILADRLAASFSRIVEGISSGGDKQEVLKLWNKNFYKNEGNNGKYWAAFKDKNDLKKLFDIIQNCESGKEFLEEYKENLLLTPEDKTPPKNVTTLYTHLELVGKIYRVLEKNSRLIEEDNGSISIEYSGRAVRTIKEAEGGRYIICKTKGEWQARLVKCWIRFPHSFVRLKDINLIRKREELLNEIASRYIDEVIFMTSDFILLFLPLQQDLSEIFKSVLEWGFYVEVTEILSDLGMLNSILDKKILELKKIDEQKELDLKKLLGLKKLLDSEKLSYLEKLSDSEKLSYLKNLLEDLLKKLKDRGAKVYKKYLMPELQNRIKPPICDICQQMQGVERIKGNVREWICKRCQEVREMGEPFREYGETWGMEETEVCWFKFYLDQNSLEKWINNAFKEYVNDKLKQDVQDISDYKLRPLALQVDFNKDYKEMLKLFWEKISEKIDNGEQVNIKKPIPDYYELGVLKYSPNRVKEIIDTFLEVFDIYFSDCTNYKESPIRLSLSVANIKYPIREHWKFFEEAEEFLNIRYHGRFEEKYRRDEIEEIINKVINSETSNYFLHKLIQMEENFQSEIYLSIEIFNNRKKYPQICEMLSKGIAPSKILNIYRLIIGGEEK
ncbi:hypothetical protein [Caloranaerobacter sp. DY30410]|uniref:hypothetical protein n=1 Tax=Caloranaerobacter sp. DY30410 TaxID=3238305 RepID=UPI003D02C52D